VPCLLQFADLLALEIPEPVWSKHGVDAIEQCPSYPCIGRALVRERIPATISQHMRMHLDHEARRCRCPIEHPREVGSREGRAALEYKQKRRCLASPCRRRSTPITPAQRNTSDCTNKAVKQDHGISCSTTTTTAIGRRGGVANRRLQPLGLVSRPRQSINVRNSLGNSLGSACVNSFRDTLILKFRSLAANRSASRHFPQRN
jgi:hypothetical protein